MRQSNRAASIRERLKQRADAMNEDFNLVLTRYGIERLLYRLSISEQASDFVLKGALLFPLWYGQTHRPTRDADLLGFGSDDVQALVGTFAALCSIAVDDGIVFDPASVRGSEIRKVTHYGGVRIDLRATLDRARIALQVDVGFGDAITPAAQPITYPSLLTDLPAPTLHAYPKATAAAEKLHAICVLGMANTRMKDFYDLRVLFADGDLKSDELRQALVATFERRRTPLPEALPIGLSDAFATDAIKQVQWHAFMRKNRLDGTPLAEVVGGIRERFVQLGIVIA